ncbi:MAG: hypothetical protein V1490_04150 [Candidatus Omnitrophota bacterium]
MKSGTNKHNRKENKKKTAGRNLVLIAVSVCLIILLALRLRAEQKVFIKKFPNGHYQLMVDKRPYIVKGFCYNPIPIGSNHEFDWWSSPYKPWIADGKLMQEMGVNTIRIYEPGIDPDAVKAVIRDLYSLYGIRTIMGHWLGFWEYPCPFYGDKQFQDKIKKEVLEMVNTYKDEPGVLLWILGNENNYSCIGTVNPWTIDEVEKEPDLQKQKKLKFKIFYSYINDIAKEIHAIDKNHPVALGNGELIGLDVANEYAPEVDLVACIIYRGKTFGNLFKSLKATFDRPILISEFGADSYDAYLKKEDQNMQAFFLESQWRQIYGNLAGNNDGAGNCLGGVMFEWSDEWWKHNQDSSDGWMLHDTESNWSNGAYYFDIKAEKNMNMNEEWFGVVALSADEKEAGLDKRIPRKSYYLIRELWKNPPQKIKGQKVK